jgi:hypothetical protein
MGLLRHRPMRPNDVRHCVDVVASHPVVGPRYGKSITDLRAAWLELLRYEAKSATVFEEVEGPAARIWGVGVSVFVHDEFLRRLKTPPFFWIGPELMRGLITGASPLISNKLLPENNSRGGLNLVVWEGCIRREDTNRAETYNKLINAFVEEHRGFLWKEIIAPQADSVETLQRMVKTGGMLLNPADGSWVHSLKRSPQEIVAEPHVIGLTRDKEILQPGSWAGSLFDYQPPQFYFSRSQQRLLISALRGGTDEDLSSELGISLSAVKKTWLAIYGRVSTVLPELRPRSSHIDSWTHDRGKEKKQRLIAYLRQRPEELRPMSRKLLQQVARHRSAGCPKQTN